MSSLSETALDRALAGDGRATPLDALRAARRMWLADQRVDMGELAREVGIGRATLYNWVGGKERLIAEVCWSLAEGTLARARQQARGRGVDYVVDVIDRYHRELAAFEPTRAFITRDPEYALRILACNRTPFQGRMIAAVRELIDEQVRAGEYDPPMDPETLAYVVVRIGESFIYSDVITGEEPDLQKAVEAQGLLLRGRPAKE
jgi:AcrR family transcriptional regulator